MVQCKTLGLKQKSYTYISNCFDTIFDTTEVSIEECCKFHK